MASEVPEQLGGEQREALADAPSAGPEAPAAAGEPPEPGGTRDSEPPREGRARRRFESRLPGMIRRGIEKGIEAGLSTFEKSLETGRETTDAVREVFSEVRLPRDVASAVGKALQEAKLPRELASAFFNQLDETKNDVLRIVAKEVRDFLEATDLANEIKAALTSLSFEVRTEIRFIPNEAGTGVRPDVRARSRVKRAATRKERRPTDRPPPPDDEDEEADS